MTITPEQLDEWQRLCEDEDARLMEVGPHRSAQRNRAYEVMRQAMPALIAEVRRLRKFIDDEELYDLLNAWDDEP